MCRHEWWTSFLSAESRIEAKRKCIAELDRLATERENNPALAIGALVSPAEMRQEIEILQESIEYHQGADCGCGG